MNDGVVGCGCLGQVLQGKRVHLDPCSVLHGNKRNSTMTSKRKSEPDKMQECGLASTITSQHAHAHKYIDGMKAVRKIQQPQRRFYTPRSIAQQTIDVQDEHLADDLNILTDNQHTHFSVQLPVSENFNSARTRRDFLHRRLGGIEKMNNIYSSQGTDIICLMTKVETVYPITPLEVRKALHLLRQRHPLLRMSIKGSENIHNCHLDFVENEKDTCDFAVSERTDWLQFMLEELEYPFNGNSQSLIRYRMLNSTKNVRKNEVSHDKFKEVNGSATDNVEDIGSSEDEFGYQATFLFIMHHSIMDGGYSLWMFQEFINFLDAVVMNMDLRGVKQLPLLPPFEDIFTVSCHRSQTRDKELKGHNLTFCHNSTNDSLLMAYNEVFQNEIEVSSNKKLQNGCLVFKFNKDKTRTLVQTIKSNNCTPKGAVTAACVLALLELVYERHFMDIAKNFEVPIEYMADFRRVGNFQIPDSNVPHYPGVAALHIPLVANLQFEDEKLTTDSFWKIAEQFGESLDKNVGSPEVYEWIKAEAAKYYKFPVQAEKSGKSPYVLSISNMGKLDGVLNSDVSGRVRLTDLHGHSSILVDDMPLFCITTFALNGHFCGNVSFCMNYTSYQTAAKYIGLLQKYLCPESKL